MNTEKEVTCFAINKQAKGGDLKIEQYKRNLPLQAKDTDRLSSVVIHLLVNTISIANRICCATMYSN